MGMAWMYIELICCKVREWCANRQVSDVDKLLYAVPYTTGMGLQVQTSPPHHTAGRHAWLSEHAGSAKADAALPPAPSAL